MNGSFTMQLPTRVHFGPDALDALPDELALYGSHVLLAYGGGSIKASGLYDRVLLALREAGKDVVECPGVMPNPTFAKVLDEAALIRENDADLVLAVGGGSVIDASKDAATLAWQDGTADELWERFFRGGENAAPSDRVTPVGCILTLPATGSETNPGGVATNEKTREKLEMIGDGVRSRPEFALLDPTLTLTLPRHQTAAGCYDIMCHCMEQYFSDEGASLSDYLAEGVMRCIRDSALVLADDPADYEARSNVMWCATWGLNGVIGLDKGQDWQLHDLAQSVGAFTRATHGMTLSALTSAYYRLMMPYGLHRFVRFAQVVWDVRPDGKTDEQIAREGLGALEAWMRRIGCAMGASELGVTEEMLEGIAAVTPAEEGAYHILTRDEMMQVLRESL